MKAVAGRFIISLILTIGVLSGTAFAQDRDFIISQDADYFGFDLRAEKEVSLDQCKTACSNDGRCQAFTYNTSARWCFLKSDFNSLRPFAGAIAGRVVNRKAELDIGAPPVLPYVTEQTANAAIEYKNKLLSQTRTDPATGVETYRAWAKSSAGNGDLENAGRYFRAAISLSPTSVGDWLGLAQSLSDDSPSNRQRVRNNGWETLLAALNAYGLTRNEETRGSALELIGRGLENTGRSVDAMAAYQAATRYPGSNTARAAIENLRRNAFKVTGHTVNVDATTPQFCATFSTALAKGVDYQPFVTINGATSGSVTARDTQICVEDLEHGKTYQVQLRAGIPSESGFALFEPVKLRAFVPDRSPFVRFTGEGFVLPAHARRGIPLVSMNAAVVDLKLFRVGDRAITNLLRDNRFLRQLDNYALTYIGDDIGMPVWEGQIEVQSDPNREVTTSFPVDEALPRRQPGIYVLSARPEGDRSDEWENRATQWFVVSDIGLTTFAGEDGLNVFTRSLASAGPLSGLPLELIAHNNEVLGTAITDENGHARFTAGLTRGKAGLAPAMIVARGNSTSDADFVFLDLTRAGFDLSDRGVSGRPSPGAVDAYSWTERGIYRVGETVHVSALVRNQAAVAVEDLPLTIVFLRPDGVEDRRVVSNNSVKGGHVVDLPLPLNAMRGTWQIQFYTDPKAEPISQNLFLVEDFVPDRIEFDLASTSQHVALGTPASVQVDGRYLYGAPAAGLAIEAEINLSTTRERHGWRGYNFGLAEEKLERFNRIPLSNLPVLAADGSARFDVSLNELPATTRPLSAGVVVRMREAGGRAVERRIELPIQPGGTMIGIRPEFDDGQVAEGSTAGFQIVAVDEAGKQRELSGAKWTLIKLERRYQWYRTTYSWNYEPIELTTVIAEGEIDLKPGQPVQVAQSVDWGRYRLEVTGVDEGGPASSVEFYAGWYVEASSTETPDALEIALDKPVYAPGDTARLKISPRFAGEVLIAVGSERLLATHRASVPAGGSTIEIPVSTDWGAGSYVTATLFRAGDSKKSRLPMRAIGIKWLAVDPSAQTLDVSLVATAQALPNKRLDVPIEVTGIQAGDRAYVTLAAVDVGILNLTNYQAPDPEKWYFGQRRLGLELRDLYGRLIDGYAGASGKIRSGGDGGPQMGSKGSPPTEALVAFFSGPVELDARGRATVGFDIPAFNGTVRLMAVAWSENAVGKAASDVVVREPVVVTASLPKFLAPGDTTRLRFDIANTDGPAGGYTVELKTAGPLSIEGPVPARLDLADGANRSLTIPVAATTVGNGSITLRLSHSDGTQVEHALAVPVRPAALPETRQMTVELAANGGSLRVDAALLQASVLPGASVSVAVSRGGAIDVSGLLMTLDRYPYGCTEQTTSRALPLLYVNELSAATGLAEDPKLRARVQKAITRVLSNQTSSGGFGLWRPWGDDMWLSAYVTDFLTRAREKNYDVPDQAIIRALDNLQNQLAYRTDIDEHGSNIAYALYVLARNRKASLSDLKYYAESRLDSFASPMARAHLAAGLGLYGDSDRASRTFAAAYRQSSALKLVRGHRSPYGSQLRDGAAILALAAETRSVSDLLPDMARHVASLADSRRYTSTQEQAWMLLAARAIGAGGDTIRLGVNGAAHSGGYSSRFDGTDLVANPLTVTNRGAAALRATVTTVAAPTEPTQAGGRGFSIERSYYRLDGTPVNIAGAVQNERYVAVIKVTHRSKQASRFIVTDLLPAGLEIDNPKLVGSAELSAFGWLGKTSAAHSEFRTDRFIAAFSKEQNGQHLYNMAYVVRAVSPGVFSHPAAAVEDMYRPQLSARTAAGWMEVRAPN